MHPLMILFLCVQDPPGAGKPQDPKVERKLDDQEERIRDLEKKVQDLEKRQAETTSANPLNLLNPRLTVVGNFLWRLDDRHVLTEEGDAIDDTANVREVEIDLRASIDPYADGVAILAVESEVPGEAAIGVEEFYLGVKSLPLSFWEEPPLGTKLKLGRFRTEIGRNNRLHLHDLPQSDRPVVMEEFFGEEGHISDGVSATMFLPSPGDTALELTFQAVQGGGIGVAEDPNHPATLANLRYFVPIADEHSFDVSLIGLYGTNDADGHRHSVTASVDFLYRWKPLRQGEFQSFVLGGQVFRTEHEFSRDLDGDGDFTRDVDVDGDGVPDDLDGDGILDDRSAQESEPLGWYLWAQVQLSRSLYAGVRVDRTEFLTDDRHDRERVTPYLSFYVSEFFRMRASFQHTWSDDPAEDELDTFLFEVNVIFGSHPPEPFWVNR